VEMIVHFIHEERQATNLSKWGVGSNDVLKKTSSSLFSFVQLSKKPVMDVSLIHRISRVLLLGYLDFFTQAEQMEYMRHNRLI
jgi:hypothetical protein